MSKYISGIKSPAFSLDVNGILSTTTIPGITTIPGVSMGLNTSTIAALELTSGSSIGLSYIDFSHTSQDYGGRILYDHNLNEMSLFTNANTTAKLYVNNLGNVGIGGRATTYLLEISGHVQAKNGSFRTTGATGWYNDTYSGGWYMTDTTAVRVSGDKHIATAGNLLVTNVNPTGVINLLSGQGINFQTNSTANKISYDAGNNLLAYDTTGIHKFFINSALGMTISTLGITIPNSYTLYTTNIDSSTGNMAVGYNTPKQTGLTSTFNVYNNNVNRTVLFAVNSGGTAGGSDNITVTTQLFVNNAINVVNGTGVENLIQRSSTTSASPLNIYMPNLSAGNFSALRTGVSSSQYNSAELRFLNVGSGSTLNSFNIAFFGTNALYTVTAGGLHTFSGTSATFNIPTILSSTLSCTTINTNGNTVTAGQINGSNISTTGGICVSSYLAPIAQGGTYSWNRNSGGGYTCFTNQQGGGSGGYEFLHYDSLFNLLPGRFVMDSVGNANTTATFTCNSLRAATAGINNANPQYALDVVGDVMARGAFLRTTGNTGWYNDTYMGGWYMNDPTTVRVYGDKHISTVGNLFVTNVNPTGVINLLNGQGINFQTNSTANKISYDVGNNLLAYGTTGIHKFFINSVLGMTISTLGITIPNSNTLYTTNIDSSTGNIAVGFNTLKQTTVSPTFNVYNNSTNRNVLFAVNTGGTTSGSDNIQINTPLFVNNVMNVINGNQNTIQNTNTTSACPLTIYVPNLVINNFSVFRTGVSDSTNNAVEFRFLNIGSGSALNSYNLAFYGSGIFYTLTAAGIHTFAGTSVLFSAPINTNGNTISCGQINATNIDGSAGNVAVGYNTPKQSVLSPTFNIYNNSTNRNVLFAVNSGGTASGSDNIQINTPLFVNNIMNVINGNQNTIQNTNTTSTCPLTIYVPNLSTGNSSVLRTGVSDSANNAAEFRFLNVGSGSTLNSLNIAFYGTNALYTVTVAGIHTFAGTSVLFSVPINTNGNTISCGQINATNIYSTGNIGIKTTSPGWSLDVVGDIRSQGGFLRTTGNTGWYNETYAGGWYMTDTTAVRAYNDKNIATGGNLLVTNVNPTGVINLLNGQGINFQTSSTANKISYDAVNNLLVYDTSTVHNFYINNILQTSISTLGITILNGKTLYTTNIDSSTGNVAVGFNTPKQSVLSPTFNVYNNSTNRNVLFAVNSGGTAGGSDNIQINTPLFVNNAMTVINGNQNTIQNINTLSACPLTIYVPNLATNNFSVFRTGVSDSTNNSVEFRFLYTSSGNTLNSYNLAFYGSGIFYTLTAAGIHTFAGTSVLFSAPINTNGNNITCGSGTISASNISVANLTVSGVLSLSSINCTTIRTTGNVGINNASPQYTLDVVGDVMARGAFLRTTGNTGWYNDTYAGGWYMNESTTVRVYGDKNIYTAGNIFGNIIAATSINTNGYSTFDGGYAPNLSCNAFCNGPGFASTTGTGTSTLCAIFNQWVLFASGYYVRSDSRIKTDIKPITDENRILSALDPCTYMYIDKRNSNMKKYGLIAQEVEKIIPEAINISTDVIPNVMKLAEKISTRSFKIDQDLHIGQIRIYISGADGSDETKMDCNIIARADNIYTVDVDITKEVVFVYGEFVDDLKSVDYNAFISILIAGYKSQEIRIKRLEALLL